LTESEGVSSDLIYARSEEDLRRAFSKENRLLISVKDQHRTIKNPTTSFTLPFLKNLSQLLDNRLELLAALDIVRHLFSESEFKAIIRAIITCVVEGYSFSKSIAEFPAYFDTLSIKTIEIAERTACLDKALHNIIDFISATESVNKRLRRSMIYPTILFIFILIAIIFWIIFVIPKFSELFCDLGMDLPWITRCVLSVSSFCNDHIIFFILILSIICFTILYLIHSRCVRDKIIAFIPILKEINRETKVMTFFYGMSLMLKEKINLLDAIMNITCNTEFGKLEGYIRNGSSLANAMKKCDIFKKYEISVIETGEQAGDLWPAFQAAANMLNSHLRDKAEKVITLIQPVTIAFIGILMIVIIYSVVVPMYSSIETVT
jgi:type II secretory pathway component PulF